MAELKQEIIQQLLNTNNFEVPLNFLIDSKNRLNLNPTYPIILISGTNGKGSTCAYLTSILTTAGYKVGTYTSPHVFSYNERIAINNKAIDDLTLTSALTKVMTHSAGINLGLFKTFTLASHLIFSQQKIDIAIMEVGIGGRLDATNIFEPTLSAITSISFDHCEVLGNTLEQIALEKAHIFRGQQPAFCAASPTPSSIINYATQIQAPLYLIERDFNYIRQQHSWDFQFADTKYYALPLPNLRGYEQLTNASLALAMLTKISPQFPVSLAHIKTGLISASLIGRFQILAGLPQIVLDTAHNLEAVETLCKNMLQLPFAKACVALFAIAKDKDWRTILSRCFTYFDHWYLAPLASPRSEDPQKLAEYLINLGVKQDKIHIDINIKHALKLAYTQLNKDDRLVCFGSFLLVEEAYQTIYEVRNAT